MLRSIGALYPSYLCLHFWQRAVDSSLSNLLCVPIDQLSEVESAQPMLLYTSVLLACLSVDCAFRTGICQFDIIPDVVRRKNVGCEASSALALFGGRTSAMLYRCSDQLEVWIHDLLTVWGLSGDQISHGDDDRYSAAYDSANNRNTPWYKRMCSCRRRAGRGRGPGSGSPRKRRTDQGKDHDKDREWYDDDAVYSWKEKDQGSRDKNRSDVEPPSGLAAKQNKSRFMSFIKKITLASDHGSDVDAEDTAIREETAAQISLSVSNLFSLQWEVVSDPKAAWCENCPAWPVVQCIMRKILGLGKSNASGETIKRMQIQVIFVLQIMLAVHLESNDVIRQATVLLKRILHGVIQVADTISLERLPERAAFLEDLSRCCSMCAIVALSHDPSMIPNPDDGFPEPRQVEHMNAAYGLVDLSIEMRGFSNRLLDAYVTKMTELYKLSIGGVSDMWTSAPANKSKKPKLGYHVKYYESFMSDRWGETVGLTYQMFPVIKTSAIPEVEDLRKFLSDSWIMMDVHLIRLFYDVTCSLYKLYQSPPPPGHAACVSYVVDVFYMAVVIKAWLLQLEPAVARMLDVPAVAVGRTTTPTSVASGSNSNDNTNTSPEEFISKMLSSLSGMAVDLVQWGIGVCEAHDRNDEWTARRMFLTSVPWIMSNTMTEATPRIREYWWSRMNDFTSLFVSSASSYNVFGTCNLSTGRNVMYSSSVALPRLDSGTDSLNDVMTHRPGSMLTDEMFPDVASRTDVVHRLGGACDWDAGAVRGCVVWPVRLGEHALSRILCSDDGKFAASLTTTSLVIPFTATDSNALPTAIATRGRVIGGSQKSRYSTLLACGTFSLLIKFAKPDVILPTVSSILEMQRQSSKSSVRSVESGSKFPMPLEAFCALHLCSMQDMRSMMLTLYDCTHSNFLSLVTPTTPLFDVVVPAQSAAPVKADNPLVPHVREFLRKLFERLNMTPLTRLFKQVLALVVDSMMDDASGDMPVSEARPWLTIYVLYVWVLCPWLSLLPEHMHGVLYGTPVSLTEGIFVHRVALLARDVLCSIVQKHVVGYVSFTQARKTPGGANVSYSNVDASPGPATPPLLPFSRTPKLLDSTSSSVSDPSAVDILSIEFESRARWCYGMFANNLEQDVKNSFSFTDTTTSSCDLIIDGVPQDMPVPRTAPPMAPPVAAPQARVSSIIMPAHTPVVGAIIAPTARRVMTPAVADGSPIAADGSPIAHYDELPSMSRSSVCPDEIGHDFRDGRISVDSRRRRENGSPDRKMPRVSTERDLPESSMNIVCLVRVGSSHLPVGAAADIIKREPSPEIIKSVSNAANFRFVVAPDMKSVTKTLWNNLLDTHIDHFWITLRLMLQPVLISDRPGSLVGDDGLNGFLSIFDMIPPKCESSPPISIPSAQWQWMIGSFSHIIMPHRQQVPVVCPTVPLGLMENNSIKRRNKPLGWIDMDPLVAYVIKASSLDQQPASEDVSASASPTTDQQR